MSQEKINQKTVTPPVHQVAPGDPPKAVKELISREKMGGRERKERERGRGTSI